MCDDGGTMNKTLGTVYGIGIGPGDPELITVKGLRLLQEVDCVFAPMASIKSQSFAADIIREQVPKEKITTVVFPMTKDEAVLQASWRDAASQMYEVIATGKNVAFITIGDPGVYSTYSYLVRHLRELDPAVSIETVPGVSIVTTTAAAFSQPLVEGNERYAVMPLPENLDELKTYAALFDTVVLMKINTRLAALIAFLEKEGLVDNAYFVHRFGCIDQYVTQSIEELKACDEKMGYLSTMVIRIAVERKER